MGWKNQQHHEFRHGKGKRLLDVIASPWDDMPQIDNFTDEREITIREFVGRKRTPLRLLYRYDFTDEWIHEVVIESKNTPEKASKKPEMIDGERACPPENAGGAHGYNACLDGTLDWMDDRYDPETFDPKKIKF